jgi:hypothetical protein
MIAAPHAGDKEPDMRRLLDRISWAIIGALALALVAVTAGLSNAGPLDPSDPPASTMKTLSEVEPRTPISAVPFVISKPGSYYLTGNLDLAAADVAIGIEASNVTLDLNGFTITGNASAFEGITDYAVIENVTIRNGTVAGFPAGGILLTAVPGVNVEDVSVRETMATSGPAIRLGARARISRCLVESDASGRAIQVGDDSVVDACTVVGGSDGIVTGSHSIVRDCNVRGASTTGIFAGANSRVERCRVASSTVYGVRLMGSNTLVDSTVDSSGVFNVLVSGGRSHIEGNHIIGGGGGVTFNSAPDANDNTVHSNTFEGMPVGFVFENDAGNDIGPVDDAATATSPFANIVMPLVAP